MSGASPDPDPPPLDLGMPEIPEPRPGSGRRPPVGEPGEHPGEQAHMPDPDPVPSHARSRSAERWFYALSVLAIVLVILLLLVPVFFPLGTLEFLLLLGLVLVLGFVAAAMLRHTNFFGRLARRFVEPFE